MDGRLYQFYGRRARIRRRLRHRQGLHIEMHRFSDALSGGNSLNNSPSSVRSVSGGKYARTGNTSLLVQ